MSDNNRPPRKPSSARPGAPPARRDAAPSAVPRDDARIAKIMARAGLCSRRDAETWIAAGRVAVNGAVIDSPALNVGPGDRITVDGVAMPEREPTRLFLFHKPRGVVTTAKDPEGRQTIFDVLPEGLPRIVTVGRLDINTEGLLLLTNDGGLARQLELPATGWLRRYRVRANGEVTQPMLDELAKGISVEGIDYAGIEAKLDRVQGANAWLTMGLREGKNREIKRVLEHLGLNVTRLIRISFGPFQLGELVEGAVEEIRPRVLRDQLGDALVREAGVEFETRAEPSREARAGADHGGERPRRAPASRQTATARPLSKFDPSHPKPGARAHVSVLRAAREEGVPEGRRRTRRSSTEDRKGRAVAVERVSSTREQDAPPDTRNARRFQRERVGEGDPRGVDGPRARREEGARPEGRGPRPGKNFSADRPATGRNRRDEARPARSQDGPSGRPSAPRRWKENGQWTDKRASHEAGERRPGGGPRVVQDATRRGRDEADGRPERRPPVRRSPAPFDTADGANPKRAPRAFDKERPAGGFKRGAGAAPAGAAPAGAAPAGRPRPFGGKPSGGRPAGGRPSGTPGGRPRPRG